MADFRSYLECQKRVGTVFQVQTKSSAGDKDVTQFFLGQ